MQKLKKSDITRARIVEQAIPLISKIGFEQLTYQKLADQAGLTQPALYSYFKSRLEILHACAKAAADMGRDIFLQKLESKTEPLERLHTYLAAHLDWIKKEKNQSYQILATFYFSATEPMMLNLYNEIQNAGITRIEEILIEGNQKKSWKIQQPSQNARAIHSLLIGEMIKLFHSKSMANFQQIQQNLKAASEALTKY